MVIGLSLNHLLLAFLCLRISANFLLKKESVSGNHNVELNIWECDTPLRKPEIPYQFLQLCCPNLYLPDNGHICTIPSRRNSTNDAEQFLCSICPHGYGSYHSTRILLTGSCLEFRQAIHCQSRMRTDQKGGENLFGERCPFYRTAGQENCTEN